MSQEDFDLSKILKRLDERISEKKQGQGGVAEPRAEFDHEEVLRKFDQVNALKGEKAPPGVLEIAKIRALELLAQGKLKEAIDSMVSDLNKDESYSSNMSMIGGMAMALRGKEDLTAEEVRQFIVGFR